MDEPGDFVGVELVAGVQHQQRPLGRQAGHQRQHGLARRGVEQPDFAGGVSEQFIHAPTVTAAAPRRNPAAGWFRGAIRG